MPVVFSSLQAALQELEELKQIVPKESLVYFLIGKVRRDACRRVITVCSDNNVCLISV